MKPCRILLATSLAVLLPEPLPASAGDRPGLVARESEYVVLLDEEGLPAARFQPGIPSTAFVWSFPVAGDFDGEGLDTVGLFEPFLARFRLRDRNTPGAPDRDFAFGRPGQIPLVGDFDGDGTDTVGTYDPATRTFALRNSNDEGPPDLSFVFGPAGAFPLAGDFDGDGTDTVGTYDPATRTFALRNSNDAGPPNLEYTFGPTGAFPFTGDHDGDGTDTAGVHHALTRTLQMRNVHAAGPPDEVITLDPVDWAWTPISGTWHVAAPGPPLGYPFPEGAPGDHGLDPAALDAGVGAASSLGFVHSLLVLRDGVLVREAYFHGFHRGLAGNVKSVSKSVLSALVGIALGDGALAIDDRLAVRLPGAFAGDLEARKRAIRLAHLVTMTAGLDWNETEVLSFFESDDWARHVTGAPLVDAPGTRFLYSTGLTHVMSRVLERATGLPASELARVRLFAPLGIDSWRWDRDPQGFDFGGAELYLVPRDLARFGQLYLEGGRRGRREIVPASWIETSTAEHVPPDWIDGDLAYGAWWWRKELGGYTDVAFAWGYGGQFAFLVPSIDLLVVVTSRWAVTGAESTSQSYAVFDLLEDHILPAVVE